MSAPQPEKITSDSHAEPRSGSIGLSRGPPTNFNEHWIKSLTATLALCTSTGRDLLCFAYQNCQMPTLTTFLSNFKGTCKSWLAVNIIQIYFKKFICLKTFKREYKWKLVKPWCCMTNNIALVN